ncbi:hypothetical protein ElyMa_005140100 [Elysia marginata]|uniref:Uncharacterized protein n=1 Tax=Elysia marginata TaxID=1093978 RepID=A0AAV4JLZ6_9GAST|nr:hypothetical protein ElyMa_005140100 [Elysia marginata]
MTARLDHYRIAHRQTTERAVAPAPGAVYKFETVAWHRTLYPPATRGTAKPRENSDGGVWVPPSSRPLFKTSRKFYCTKRSRL